MYSEKQKQKQRNPFVAAAILDTNWLPSIAIRAFQMLWNLGRLVLIMSLELMSAFPRLRRKIGRGRREDGILL